MTIGRPPKATPPGFVEFAAAHYAHEVRAHFGIGKVAYRRMMREAGLIPIVIGKRLDVPSDFAANARRPNAELRIHYGLSTALIARFRKQVGISAAPQIVPRKPIPVDFLARAPKLDRRAAMAWWGCSDRVLRRWCRETGITLKVSPRPAPANDVEITIDQAVTSAAAQHLRRHFPNVYRAEILSTTQRKVMPNEGKGMFVVVGRGVLSGEQVVELARKHGFEGVMV